MSNVKLRDNYYASHQRRQAQPCRMIEEIIYPQTGAAEAPADLRKDLGWLLPATNLYDLFSEL